MADLERELRDLAGDVAWPATPDLAAAVRARIAHRPLRSSGAPFRRRSRRLALAVASALVAIPAAAFAVPASRDAILETLGLRHVAVERVPHVPPGGGPVLGRGTTLADAARLAGFTPRVAAALGPPSAVHVEQRIVTLTYDLQHALLAQARGALDRAILHKIVAVDARVRPVRVNGAPGLWLPSPHAYAWTDATGPPVRSGPALVWEQDGLVLRLEGVPSLDRAVAVAESVR
jgi:hypothetical protein